MTSTTVRILTATDLHQRRSLYQQLHSAVALHRPDVVALVGDFLHAGSRVKGMLSAAQCSLQLNALPADEIICVRGNHEDENWRDFNAGRIRCLNGEAFEFGPLVIIGFPCLLGDESWFLEEAEGLPADPGVWLRPIIGHYGAAARTLWIMHEPADCTLLTEVSGPLSGNPEWREAVQSYAPLSVISGHDHDTPLRGGCWHDRIGPSCLINAGQTDNILQYVIIEATFDSSTASLPRRIVITRFPSSETLSLESESQGTRAL